MRSERKKDRERLEQETQGEAYLLLLRRLQQPDALLCRFRTWADVFAFMQTGSPHEPGKDEVLRAILQARGEDQDTRWQTVIMAIFWPRLESIRHHKRRWDRNAEELWQAIVCTFLRAASRLDMKKRSTRLTAKLCNDTIHHLHDQYRQIWDRAAVEIPTDPQVLDGLPSDTWEAALAKVRTREDQEAEIEKLRGHMLAGRLTKDDFLLLVATRVYGQSVADYAREIGLDYQVAKKRRQRAEAILRRVEGGVR